MKLPRFSLRSLLLATAIIGMLLDCIGKGLWWVHERETLLSLMFSPDGVNMGTIAGESQKPMPFMWHVLGARPLSEIIIDPTASDELMQRFTAAFPEAKVHRGDPSVVRDSKSAKNFTYAPRVKNPFTATASKRHDSP